ncbi:MAG: hypothetical protein J6Y89_02360, partial [Lachnospiraceae bacterium]|nr:hypothetical protein [Lachnospiraceae bacterium]
MGMRKKIFNGLLIMLICAAASLFGGSAVETHAVMRDITYSFYMDITVNGTVGSAIEEQTCTISINGGTALVRPISAGTDISKWFMGSETPLPAGLKVTVAEDAAVGAKKLKVKFSGTVYGASKDEIKIVPQNIYFDDTESDWYAYANVNLGSSIAKFNITRNASTPSGYSGVGQGIYVKDQKSGTAGWILKGAKGTAITSDNEMQVYINGNFLKPLSAGADISYWFTGELYVYKEIFNASIASVLPDGVVARVKNAVSVGDNSFTIVFSGTPAKGSMDLIAFTIPAGMVSFSKGGATKGDYQEGCKVTNNTCKYAYDISTDNDGDLHTEFVKITYPEATLEAGKPVTEEDNLLITYELVGEVNRTPITFQGITLNHTTVRGMCYQNAGNQYPVGFWNDHITTSTGLQATVIAISQDQRTVTARITGTPKKQDSYPYVLRGRGFILNASYNNANHLITGYTSGDTTLTIVEPAPEITINKNVTIYKGEDDEKTTITNAHFTISLGDDTLAKAISKGEGLPLFYPETHKDYDRLSDNGVSIYADEDTPAGAHEIKVYVSVYEKGIRWTQKGYLNLAFPQDYITRTANYGTQKYYNIPFSRIYEDITKKEEVVRVNELSDLLITGTLNNELIEETYLHKWYDGEHQYHEEWDTRVTGIKLNPIGTEKLYFTLTCFYGLNVEKSYEAGDSVLDFVKLNLYSDDKESPFYIDTWSSQFVKKDFKFYDIHTVDPIEAGRTETPRVFNLMIDLSEFYAMKASTKPVHLYIKYIDDSGIRPVYTNTFS